MASAKTRASLPIGLPSAARLQPALAPAKAATSTPGARHLGKTILTLARIAVSAAAFALSPPSARATELVKIESAHAVPHPGADRLLRTGAAVTPVSRVSGLHDHALSAFIVDYAPGGSAMLHRSPSS